VVWGSTVSSPNGVWGGAAVEIEFDAFKPKKLASGGTNFSFSLTFPDQSNSRTFFSFPLPVGILVTVVSVTPFEVVS